MEQYKRLIDRIILEGSHSNDRTGVGTTRIFGGNMSFDMDEGFPLLTIKHTSINMIAHELLWMISGDTNIKYLVDNDCHIWDKWADENGNIGKQMYGGSWRNSGGTYRKFINGIWAQNGIDQLGNAIELIKNNPNSRRIIVDAWEVSKLPKDGLSPQENVSLGLNALAPCHMFFQFFVHPTGKLDILMFQRSVDSFLGLSYNLASYALLLHMVAQVTGKVANKLHWVGGDIHLYDNHKDQIAEMMSREPLKLPNLQLNPNIKNINDFTINDITLKNYNSHPRINAPIAV